MTDLWKLYEITAERSRQHSESVGILLGHMTNAIIDLQTGTKAQAISTLERGIALIHARQKPMRDLADAIADTRPKDGDALAAPLASGGGAKQSPITLCNQTTP